MEEYTVESIDEDLVQKIATLLDNEDQVEAKDARLLGEKVGMSKGNINILWRGRGQRKTNPTETILEKWIEMAETEPTVHQLKCHLVEMKRMDAVRVIKENYPDLQTSDVLLREMNNSTRVTIANLLDIQDGLQCNDARKLGRKVGIKRDVIELLWNAHSRDVKPTVWILDWWTKDTNTTPTVKQLIQHLKDMRRMDVLALLYKEYPHLAPGQTSETEANSNKRQSVNDGGKPLKLPCTESSGTGNLVTDGGPCSQPTRALEQGQTPEAEATIDKQCVSNAGKSLTTCTGSYGTIKLVTDGDKHANGTNAGGQSNLSNGENPISSSFLNKVCGLTNCYGRIAKPKSTLPSEPLRVFPAVNSDCHKVVATAFVFEKADGTKWAISWNIDKIALNCRLHEGNTVHDVQLVPCRKKEELLFKNLSSNEHTCGINVPTFKEFNNGDLNLGSPVLYKTSRSVECRGKPSSTVRCSQMLVVKSTKRCKMRKEENEKRRSCYSRPRSVLKSGKFRTESTVHGAPLLNIKGDFLGIVASKERNKVSLYPVGELVGNLDDTD